MAFFVHYLFLFSTNQIDCGEAITRGAARPALGLAIQISPPNPFRIFMNDKGIGLGQGLPALPYPPP